MEHQSQIILHTEVLYYDTVKQVTSFCTVPSCNKHEPSTKWAHLAPVMKMIKEKEPNIDTLHFFFLIGLQLSTSRKIIFTYSLREFLNMDLNKAHGHFLIQDMGKVLLMGLVNF